MSSVLVYLQQENGKLNSAALSALSAAVQISKQGALTLVGVTLGMGAHAVAQQASTLGLSSILWSEQAALKHFIGLHYAEALAAAARKCAASYVVGASTSAGKDILPAVAAHLDAGMISEALAVLEGGKFLRPMYAGNVLAEVTLESAIKVVSVRASAFPAAATNSTSATVEELSYAPSGKAFGEVVSFDSSGTGRPDLADAKIVVSGGRGVQSKEGFEKYINPLADALGAAIGASRAAVDAGFAPNDWQVGQTGKTVAPQLYIAVGISGAIQHLAGMKDAKVVVAINKDAEAPIFEVADYGLVADLEKAVPELIDLIKA